MGSFAKLLITCCNRAFLTTRIHVWWVGACHVGRPTFVAFDLRSFQELPAESAMDPAMLPAERLCCEDPLIDGLASVAPHPKQSGQFAGWHLPDMARLVAELKARPSPAPVAMASESGRRSVRRHCGLCLARPKCVATKWDGSWSVRRGRFFHGRTKASQRGDLCRSVAAMHQAKTRLFCHVWITRDRGVKRNSPSLLFGGLHRLPLGWIPTINCQQNLAVGQNPADPS